MKLRIAIFAARLLILQLAGGTPPSSGGEPPAFLLLPHAQVDSRGIFLSQVVTSRAALPQIRLGAAPAPGQTVTLTRAQIGELLQKAAPELAASSWGGANQVRVARRLRLLGEAELRDELTAVLQRDYVKDKGELELRFARPWTAVNIPDEAFTLKIQDLPSNGLSANFIVRFELRTGDESVGSWQIPSQARVWREIWVARSTLRRGQLLASADLAQERRDVLLLRDLLDAAATQDSTLELAENVPAGIPLTLRSVRIRPLVHRGKVVEALVRDGALHISLKVEVLEEGIPGQTVRVRNLQSRREFYGKVHDEQTILVSL
ncbi:MAG: flagellar basal body P-ring formation chaperone FlgA [Verrucomicrobiota bacterium]